MKIVFFGSSEFAVPSLEMLLNSQYEVLAIVTQPDRKSGRHLKISATPVKEAVCSRSIAVYQPENVNDPSFVKNLKSLSADLFIVVSFGQILSKDVLDVPGRYSINLHASLLPKYRGAAPVNWAIIKGEKKTGLTIIRMDERMDAGDVMLQRAIEVEREDTAETLKRRLSDLGAVLLLDSVRFIARDKVTFKKQDNRKATQAPKLKKEDGMIDWGKNAVDISNMVRGLVPWPCAYTFLDGKLLKIWKTEVLSSREKNAAGKIIDVTDNAIFVSCGQDLLLIKELQAEGGKRMDTASFLRGHKLEKDAILGNADNTGGMSG
ncbi:MAG: methionyl-tRNA formyltransferase [Candidatus Omnitrophica bacterium]|nr:methionyl-tRNA formyltransferase [Candidatus Omnitrophota bacterium]